MDEELLSVEITEKEREWLHSGILRLLDHRMPTTDEDFAMLELIDKLYSDRRVI